MQLQNIQQQIVKHVEVYYECLLKLTNCIQSKITDFFLTTIFRACLLFYLRLTVTSMKRNTLIEHKEVVVICEESDMLMNYNILLTTPKANVGVKHVVHAMTTKSTLTCTNCGKIGHLVETCHNKKREVPVVLIAIVKYIEFIARIET
jgi:hypothetical protein